jgi:hypothetical protein
MEKNEDLSNVYEISLFWRSLHYQYLFVGDITICWMQVATAPNSAIFRILKDRNLASADYHGDRDACRYGHHWFARNRTLCQDSLSLP